MRMEVNEGSSWAVATLVEKSSGDAWNVKFDHGSLIQGVQADRMRVSRCHCFTFHRVCLVMVFGGMVCCSPMVFGSLLAGNLQHSLSC